MTEATSKTTSKAQAASHGKAAQDFIAKSQAAAETWFRAGAEAWTGNYDTWKALTQDNGAATFDGIANWDEVAETGKETLDAWVASGKIAVEGFGTIADKLAAGMTASMTAGVAASKAMLECKDLKSLVELQTRQARNAFDTWLAEGNAITELTAETAVKAAAPIGRQLSAVFDKAVKATV